MSVKDLAVNVVGVTFKNENGTSRREYISEMIDKIQANGFPPAIILKREPTNKYDVNAVMVMHYDMEDQDNQLKQIGYIGKDYAEILAPMMDSGVEFTACIRYENDKFKIGLHKNRPYCHIAINQVAPNE